MIIDQRIVIIGGGPAGCAAAAYALKLGFKNVILLEASSKLGGLHKDIEINGLHFDLGAFFFWGHHQLLALFPDLKQHLVFAESEHHMSLSNRYNLDRYPMTLKGYVRDYGWLETFWDLFQLALRRMLSSEKDCHHVDQLMLLLMGPFYRKSGLKNYIRRLFCQDPAGIHIEFAYTRLGGVVEKFRFKNIRRNLLRANYDYFVHYPIEKNVWARPESGFGTMYDCISSTIIKAGGEIRYNSKVDWIDPERQIVRTTDGQLIEFDYLLSSQSLQAMSKISKIPFNLSLKYQPLCSLFYETKQQVFPECFVLFNFTSKGQWKRITFHSNYYNRNNSSSVGKRHYFTVESMPDRDHLQMSDLPHTLDKDFRDTFQNTKWSDVFNDAVLIGNHITENAYPVFDEGFDRTAVESFNNNLREKNIYNIGRQGEFEHVSSSDACRSGMNAIDLIWKKTTCQVV